MNKYYNIEACIDGDWFVLMKLENQETAKRYLSSMRSRGWLVRSVVHKYKINKNVGEWTAISIDKENWYKTNKKYILSIGIFLLVFHLTYCLIGK